MQLASVVSRLNAISDFAGRVFLEANDAEAIQRVQQIVPTGTNGAVVFGPRETADKSERLGGVEQRITVRFMILICARYAGEAMAAYASLDTLIATTRSQLLGWVPAIGYRELHLQSGALLYTSPGLLIWGDTFDTFYYIEA